MGKYSFELIQEGSSLFIKLGTDTERLVKLFLSCLDPEEIKKLYHHIHEQGKYIESHEQGILLDLLSMGTKIAKKLDIEITHKDNNLPYKQELFLLLSARKTDEGDIIYNYRAKLIEVIETYQESFENVVNIQTSVLEGVQVQDIDEQTKVLLDSKKDLEDESKQFNDLSANVEANLKEIDRIDQEITSLNQRIKDANASQKLEIYRENALLIEKKNQLLEANEKIEYEAQGEIKQIDTTTLKVIKKIYQSRTSEIDLEIRSHQERLTQYPTLGVSQLTFSSNYQPYVQPFIIKNILKRKSVSKHESVYAVLFNMLNRGYEIKPSDKIAQLSQNDRQQVYQFQMVMLSHLRYGYLDDLTWNYNIQIEHQKLFKVAYEEIIHWIEKISLLKQSTYDIPKLVMNHPSGYHIRFLEDSKNPHAVVIRNVYHDVKKTDLWISDLITYNINPSRKDHERILNELLTWLFNFPSFRDGQLPIIANYLNGHNTLGVLPTGAGKSLTYYFCVLMQPKISLVIAPINSLILDQIEKLNDLHGVSRLTNMTSSNKGIRKDIESFERGESLFNFTSPERAQSQRFRDTLIALNHTQMIGSIILDEVHCLSEWGHDFRVPYLMLAETLNTYAQGIRYLGLTATASVNVVRDLMIELVIKEKDVITTEQMRRNNLEFEIKSFSDVDSAQDELTSMIIKNLNQKTLTDVSDAHDKKNAILIFSQTKKTLPTSVEMLNMLISYRLNAIKQGYDRLIARYTGELKDEQSDFMHDKKTIMIATKAFGMGIDKSNIRMTVHFGMPSSREAFYQEAGRAGRDGEKALCKLFAIRPREANVSKLVREFLNPNTDTYRMKEIMQYLSRLKIDIATTFYFFLEGYEEPKIESFKTAEYYRVIQNHQGYHWQFKEVEKKKTEKYLYILFKLGIVKTWYVGYLMDKNELSSYVDIDVEINHRYEDIDHIKRCALKYINAYHSQDDEHVIEAEKVYVNRIEIVTSINELQELVLAMREWYHSLFITTRREQISNMYDMINDFANKGPTAEIQDVIDRFFNISEVIGKTKEGYDLLTFEGISLKDVVRYAFELDQEILSDRKYEMQVILQSNVNVKNSLYTSLVHLRLNEFSDTHNGDQRFEFALSQMNQQEKEEAVDACIDHYQSLSEEQKLMFIPYMRKFDGHVIHKIYEINQEDEIITEYALAYLYTKFDESWS